MKPMLLFVVGLSIAGCDKTKLENPTPELLRRKKAAESRIEDLEKQVSRAQEIQRKSDTLISILQGENRKLISDSVSLQGQLDLANSRMQTMRELGRAEAQLESLTTSRSVSNTYIPAPAVITPQPEPEPPAWRYPSTHEASKIIREAAEEKWGENFRMVEHEIERQTTAHEGLHGYEKKRWSNPVIRRALNAAGNKWGTNFNMVLYEIEHQLEAKDRLDSKR